MSRSRVEDIFELLKRAQETTPVALTIDECPTLVEMNAVELPENCQAARRDMDRYLDKGTWKTGGPVFRRLREWVQVHWNPDGEKTAPHGTVPTDDPHGGRRGWRQLVDGAFGDGKPIDPSAREPGRIQR